MPGLKTNEREGTRAVLRHARVAPNKIREVLDLVRNRPVHEAEDILRFSERDAAFTVGKVLRSAVANAENNDELDSEELYVSACFADEGTTIKRWRPRARGRATRIRKRTTHITIIVSRLPEAELERLVARRRAEQLAQRARRVAGARKSSDDTRSRAQRRRNEPIETPDDESTEPSATEPSATEPSAAEVAAEAEEQGIVDADALAVASEDAEGTIETTADTEADDAMAATDAGAVAAAEDEAGIVDTTAAAVAAEEAEEAGAAEEADAEQTTTPPEGATDQAKDDT